ncbi:hypothetical protein DERP_005861 [Dermatophagoides pteronyssinus]|uniref:Uncharacterized protein n=1 Tax=Dermatophagoides pteronyssinus TaxID=6956 RepID=A0ABQ8JAG6_DERPT|nr:hypothetical protein DERP_005861 [Dermatophagoides pteronyssinus]
MKFCHVNNAENNINDNNDDDIRIKGWKIQMSNFICQQFLRMRKTIHSSKIIEMFIEKQEYII